MKLVRNNFWSDDIRQENEKFHNEWISKSQFKEGQPLTLDDLNIPSEQQNDSIKFQVVWLQNVVRLCNMLPSEVDFSDHILYDTANGSGT